MGSHNIDAIASADERNKGQLILFKCLTTQSMASKLSLHMVQCKSYPLHEIVFGENERIGLIETNGNIHLIDENLSMRVKEESPTDPIVIEILYG